MKVKTILYLIVFTQLLASIASAQGSLTELIEVNKVMRNIAAALAVFMFTLQGLKWVTAESAPDRLEAKRGMIYVMLGLLVVFIAANIVCGLYGVALGPYSITCTFDSANFNCQCT